MSLSALAQSQYVHQVIFLNEGQYDYTNSVQITPVSVGAYDPVTDVYTEFDQISGARFGSDVIIDGDYIYVAADTKIVKYDANTLTEVGSASVPGIRKIAIWNNQILVTIGESAPHSSYFRVFDKTSLTLIYELDTLAGFGPVYSTEGVVVLNDTAYIAISNAFEWGNAKGAIGLVDLNNQSYMAEVDITPDGLNPDNLMISGTTLYTLNNMDWTNSSITEFNTLDRTFSTTLLGAASGCGASVFADNNIFFHRYDYNMSWADTNSTLNIFNITNQGTDTIYPNLLNVYGMADDAINSQIYLTTTDFFSFGKAYKMDYSGNLTDSFDVGISAGNIALDVRDLVGINEQSNVNAFDIHPNPSSSIVYIEVDKELDSYALTITDITGRVVYSEVVLQTITKSVNIENWSNGVYMLTIATEDGKSTHKIVKQ